MKKLYFFLLVIIIFVGKVEAKKIKGTIISKNDTVEVLFNIPIDLMSQEPNYQRLQDGVRHYDSSGKKLIVRPEEVKEIRFTYANEEIRMLSRIYIPAGTFSVPTFVFLQLIKDGKLKMFKSYFHQTSSGLTDPATGMNTGPNSYTFENYLLQKEDEELMQPGGWTFKKDIAEYLSDCPDLVRRVENKYFRKNDLESIVDFYNRNCK